MSNKVSKNKQVVLVPGKNNKNKQAVAATSAANANSKVKNAGAIEALVPGYVTDQGEVLVPVDTVTGSQPITIVPGMNVGIWPKLHEFIKNRLLMVFF